MTIESTVIGPFVDGSHRHSRAVVDFGVDRWSRTREKVLDEYQTVRQDGAAP
jgi:hypothetical protein